MHIYISLVASYQTCILVSFMLAFLFQNCFISDSIPTWFFAIVSSYSQRELRQLLKFITGSSRLPIQGFSSLQGTAKSNKPFTLHVVDTLSTDALPKAHTCFNRLDVPKYETMEKFANKLRLAVDETEGFGVE